MVDLNLHQPSESHDGAEPTREVYLSVDEPVLDALARHLHYIRTVNKVEPTPKAIANLRNDLVLQYHHGGTQVICRRTEQGVIVLAAGPREVTRILETTPEVLESLYVLEFPIPW